MARKAATDSPTGTPVSQVTRGAYPLPGKRGASGTWSFVPFHWKPGADTAGLKWIDRYFVLLFLAPGMLCLVGVILYPVVWNSVAAFTNASLVYDDWKFVKLRNFAVILGDAAFWNATARTLIWTVASVSLQVILGVIAALSLERMQRSRALFRTLLIIPWAYPAIVMAFVWRYMLDAQYGVANYALMMLHLIDRPVAWLGEVDTAMASIVAMNTWFGFPFMMVCFVAGLQMIPKELFEAARVDGASAWREFLHITLPGLRGVIGTVIVLRTIWVFNNFEFPYLTTGGGPIDATTTLPIYAFKIGWQQYEIGRMAAVSMVMIAVLSILIVIYFSLFREGNDA